jgi:Alpha-L-arabinofuranosidase B, catalytic
MSRGGPLDFLSATANVSGAYSCARRLSFAYAGPLCNIRRASDSLAADFYSDSIGVIDKSALDSFCANTSCFIVTEYDQSGNGNAAHNGTATTQPTLTIESSALSYSVCGTWGNGGNASLTIAGNSSINGLFSNGGFASAVSNKTATISNAMRLISKLTGGTGWELSGAYTLGYGYPQFSVDASGANGAWVSNSFMPSSGGHIFDVSYNESSLSNLPTLAIDGNPLTYQSSTQPSGTPSDTNGLIIGNNASGGFGWPGDICEVFLRRQALSGAQIDAVRRNQASFYGLGGVL